MSDIDLLQNYVSTNSQEAFAALVDRHLNLVYSAARRQVRSPQLAEEVAQSVFIDLSRNAAKIRPAQPLAAWLFLVTRRTAVDVVRRESRRQIREQIAAEIADMKHQASPTWEQVRDVLDEAMESLNDTERSALLLRFFENRSLREVGNSLGISEDTAQKRVSRALDRLRGLLLRRGVAVSAAGLAADLSAHGIQIAPAALGAMIVSSASVSTAVVSAALAKVTQTAALSIAQKSVAAAATAAVFGLVVYQAGDLFAQRTALAQFPADANRLRATRGALDRSADDAGRRLQSTRSDLARLASLRSSSDPDLETAVEAWFERSRRLRQLATSRPDLDIPELEILTDDNWFSQAKTARFETEEQIRDTFQKIHRAARETLARKLGDAMSRYAAANANQLPANPAQLRPFVEPEVSVSLFGRFEMLQSGALNVVPRGEWVLAERAEAAQPRETRIFVAAQNYGIEDLTSVSDRELRLAGRAFADAHNGQLPADPAQLVPYFKTAPGAPALKALLEKTRNEFATDLKKLLETNGTRARP